MTTLLNRGHERSQYVTSAVINIDNGSGTTLDEILLVPNRPVQVVSARVFYTEATDTAGAASATIAIGIAVGGAQVVAATALEVSKAVGSTTDLTIVDGHVAAGEILAVRHTGIAATEAGQYRVQVEYRIKNA